MPTIQFQSANVFAKACFRVYDVHLAEMTTIVAKLLFYINFHIIFVRHVIDVWQCTVIQCV